MSDIIIREMRDSDLAGVSAIVCNCYRLLAKHEGLTQGQLVHLLSVRGSEEAIQSQRQQQLFLVAVEDNTLMGVASIENNELAKLYVDPVFHGRGIGKRLFQEAQQFIFGNGYTEMFLGAFSSAIPFYERLGMTVSHWKDINRGPLTGRKQAVMTISLCE
jgi:GNAT superfamily N-acetyltransferase